jgi:O-antigen ligase
VLELRSVANPLSRRLGKALEIGGIIYIMITSEAINIPPSIFNLVNITTYVIVGILVICHWKKVTYIATRDIPLLLLVGLATISIFWSGNPSYTIKDVRGLLRLTLFGAYLAARYSSREQVRLLSWMIGIAMFISTVVALALPDYGTHIVNHHLAWRGIYKHKQFFGRFLSLGISVFLITVFDKQDNKWIALAGLSFTLLLLLVSTSKTSLVAFLMLLLLLPFYKIARQYKYRAAILIIVLFVYVSVASLISLNLETIVVDLLKKDLEFNGRTPIWTLSIEKALQQPWLGYGYSGFWSSEEAQYILSRTWLALEDPNVVFHAHNGFIDLFLQLGLSGILLFIISFTTLLKRIVTLITLTRSIESFWMIEFLAIALLANFSESAMILSSTNIYWLLYVMICFSSALECSRISKNGKITT